MALFQKNVRFGRPLKLSSWRKVAIGTWNTVGDPSVYGLAEFDVTAVNQYINDLKTKTGKKITLTHFVGKAVAETIRRHPEINCSLRFGKLYPRKSVDIFFQVASDNTGEDLSGTTIRNADQKTTIEIADQMHQKVTTIRTKDDPDYKQMKSLMGLIPGFLTKMMINLSGFIMYTLNIWSPLLGVPRDSFGSVMITNIGSIGLDIAFAPIVPYSRVPILIAVSSVCETPCVIDGKIEIRPKVKLCATFDHRLIDGIHASHMSHTLKAIFKNPSKELKEN